MTRDDTPEIDLVLVGDFDAFYRANWSRVVGALRVAFGSASLGEDAAQEAFVKTYVRWKRVRGMARPDRWVMVVAFRMGMRMARRRPEARLAEAHDRSGDVPTPLEQHDGFSGALAPLTERQRIAAVLRYECDLPTKEIARTMGCADSTVRALLSQATDRLRALHRGDQDR